LLCEDPEGTEAPQLLTAAAISPLAVLAGICRKIGRTIRAKLLRFSWWHYSSRVNIVKPVLRSPIRSVPCCVYVQPARQVHLTGMPHSDALRQCGGGQRAAEAPGRDAAGKVLCLPARVCMQTCGPGSIDSDVPARSGRSFTAKAQRRSARCKVACLSSLEPTTARACSQRRWPWRTRRAPAGSQGGCSELHSSTCLLFGRNTHKGSTAAGS